MCAANGTLRAAGYELEEPGTPPQMVTTVRELRTPVTVAAV
jgi:hypothetical protein